MQVQQSRCKGAAVQRSKGAGEEVQRCRGTEYVLKFSREGDCAGADERACAKVGAELQMQR